MSSQPPTVVPSPAERPDYKKSLNLPQTPFPMKANLVQNEPASIKRWDKARLYAKVQEARKGAPRFVFHDGPPYANGDIHLGHLLNKCLKDFVVRTRTMAGQDCPYVPGWDCHGLPIEHKVVTELVESGKYEKIAGLSEDARRMAIRRECQKYAEKYVKLQAGQMQRLLTLADYEDPYLTMHPRFEAATLELFAEMVGQGIVFRQLKPVHWSIANQTALAEAELEYYEREDLSVYVDFEAADADAVYDAFGLPAAPTEDSEELEASGASFPGGRPTTRPSFMIWTTTPWTLPANLAIAAHPKFEYALVRIDGAVTVMAAALAEKVAKAAKAEEVEVIATTTGERLIGLRYRHPFVDTAALERHVGAGALHHVAGAEYVTLEDGTGLVHTAPGHGVEDYQTGLREKLGVYCPVQGDGSYDDSVPEWLRGKNIWKANAEIVERLRGSGHLFHDHKFMHSYPHDWRGKSPVIFRATEQWFIGVDKPTKRDGRSLRQTALDEAENKVAFVPEWGRNRLRGMLESRPDWCISRQRAWGLPIPAFEMDAGEESITLLTRASAMAVAAVVREKGSDAWFTMAPADLLKGWDAAKDPDAPKGVDIAKLRKCSDILDVWFESGSSWRSVMHERGIGFPVDLYLEGSDQHRGWFQSSMLCGIGGTGQAPYRTLLTHGFIVDRDGKKMSKSLGNTLGVDALMKDFGADVCRWWVATLAFENDIKADLEFFKTSGEAYRKVRNTLRFMLSNLYDFEPSPPGKDHSCGEGMCVPMSAFEPTMLDTWALAQFDALSEAVKKAYERYDFRAATQKIYDFCSDTLSSIYLAAVKDRLYCDRADSARRRRTQSALWDMTDGLCRLLAPLLPHTADEAWRALHRLPADSDRTVHTLKFLEPFGVKPDGAWGEFVALRDRALVALEEVRKAEGGIENPLDAGLTLPDSAGSLRRLDTTDLADLLGVSRVSLDAGATAAQVVDLRAEPRCERSWKRDGTVKRRSDGGMLSDRDAEAVGVS